MSCCDAHVMTMLLSSSSRQNIGFKLTIKSLVYEMLFITTPFDLLQEYNVPSRIPTMKSSILTVILVVIVFVSLENDFVSAANLHKRSFATLGCMGVYDKSKFARLDRVCEECYQIFRQPDIHTSCRQDCFTNDVFTRCVDVLLLQSEHPKLQSYISDLAVGRR